MTLKELGLRKDAAAVYRADKLMAVTDKHLSFLKETMEEENLPRARICLHESDSSQVQEMIVCLRKNSYIRPHSHKNRTESGHVIEGTAHLLFFENAGKIETGVTCSLDNVIHYRIPSGVVHSQIIISEFFIFKEVLPGPFTSSDTFFPEWSEENSSIGLDIINSLNNERITTLGNGF